MTNLQGPLFPVHRSHLPFILLVIAGMSVVIWLLSHSNKTDSDVSVAISSTPTPSTTPIMYRIVAVPGDGLSILAARAVDECLQKNPDLPILSAVERLWAIHQLQSSIPRHVLYPGDAISFSHDVVAHIITSAKTISPVTRNSLAPYLQ